MKKKMKLEKVMMKIKRVRMMKMMMNKNKHCTIRYD
jgi:hypothetical protein